MNDAGDSHKRGTKHDSSRCRKRGVITERMRPSFTVCLSPRFASSWLLNRRGFQCWCVLRFLAFRFRLVRRKILLVLVDDRATSAQSVSVNGHEFSATFRLEKFNQIGHILAG